MIRRPPRSTLFPTRRSSDLLFETENPSALIGSLAESVLTETVLGMPVDEVLTTGRLAIQEHVKTRTRSEEHTSELQSQSNLVCRLLLEKKKNTYRHRLSEYQ